MPIKTQNLNVKNVPFNCIMGDGNIDKNCDGRQKIARTRYGNVNKTQT